MSESFSMGVYEGAERASEMKLVGQTFNQAAKPFSAFFEVWDFDEFVGGVGLGFLTSSMFS